MTSPPPGPVSELLPVALLERIADHIFDVEEWPAATFTRTNLDQLRSCYDILEFRPSALAVIQRRVDQRSSSSTVLPLIRRRLVPANTADDWERDTLFKGQLVRGPCCYLKLRCYDQQPTSGVPDYSNECYYATTGIMLVPAIPPIVQCMVLVNEQLRRVLSVVKT